MRGRRIRHGNGDGELVLSTTLGGKIAIITGASRGIGLAIARRLVSDGANVVITARTTDALVESATQLGPDRAAWIAGAADDSRHQEAAVTTGLERFGRIDFLVNNTGINPAYGPLLETNTAVGAKIFAVNVLAALSWTQHVHRSWMAQHGGAVVNVASVAGLKPAEHIGLYGASKAALLYLTEQVAQELGPDIRVNAVAPAVVKTKFAAALYAGREAAIAQSYPLKRLGHPDDIAGAVSFLLSDDAVWITGRTLTVDGGLTLVGGV